MWDSVKINYSVCVHSNEHTHCVHTVFDVFFGQQQCSMAQRKKIYQAVQAILYMLVGLVHCWFWEKYIISPHLFFSSVLYIYIYVYIYIYI